MNEHAKQLREELQEVVPAIQAAAKNTALAGSEAERAMRELAIEALAIVSRIDRMIESGRTDAEIMAEAGPRVAGLKVKFRRAATEHLGDDWLNLM